MRFKAYQRDCPHHGFSEVQLLRLFYSGVDWRYQVALDSASDGNFNTRSPEEARRLIENLVSSNSAKNADFERKQLAESKGGVQGAELKSKLDSIHNLLVGKKQVHFAQDVETFEPTEESEEEDVNYVGGAGYQNQRFGNQQGNRSYNSNGQRNAFTGAQNSSGYTQKPFQSSNNSSFTRNYGSSSYQPVPPKDSIESKMESMLERILEGQSKQTVEFNGKLDAMYTDLNGKFEALNIHVKKLDTQVAQTASAVQRQEGFLPGRTEGNPKRPVNAIMLRSGKQLKPVQKKGVTPAEVVDLGEFEEDDFRDTADASVDAETMHRSMHASNSGISSRDGRKSTQHDAKDEASIDDTGVDRRRGDSIGRCTPKSETSSPDGQKSIQLDAPPSTQQSIDRCNVGVDRRSSRMEPRSSTCPNPAAGTVYKPKIPFSKDPKKSKQELDDAKCKAIMDKLIVEIPLIEAMRNSPMIKRYMKKMMSSNLNTEESVMMVSARISAVIQNKIPEKLPDPGSFVLDCTIFDDRFERSLCDLGSSVNLMPLSVAVSLGMTDFQSTGITLVLADRSIRVPEGILEDVPVMIGECLIPTDFVVLEYEKEPKDPLILGRSFLATAGAIINVKAGRIGLHVGDLIMNFDMDKVVKKPTIDGQTFYVDTLDNLAEQVFNELHHEVRDKKGVDNGVADHLSRLRVDEDVPIDVFLPEEKVYAIEVGTRSEFVENRRNCQRTDVASIDTYLSIDRCGVLTNPNQRKIISRKFEPNDQVLLYNSRLQWFPGQLRFRWSGPFTITEIRPYGAVVLRNSEGKELTVNGQRVKHYWAQAEIPDGQIVRLGDAPSA